MLPQRPRKLKILDLDTESRPLSYWGERPTAEITAIAWCFTDNIGSMEVRLLGVHDPVDMLQSFVTVYNIADIVTAHNIRRFDLPMINGNLMEYGLPKLTPKLTIDTYGDMVKRGDIPASQEYLLDLFGIGTKLHMGQHSWREANRLLPQGIEKARQRVTGDVYDHMRLRPEMLKRNLLKPPKMWFP
jgi:hypothetical protein